MKYVPLFFCLVLANCATNTNVCPQIRNYSLIEQQKQADAEMLLSRDSPLIDPLLEWEKLRAQLKICNGVE
jgi:hypothetical protein